MSEQKVIWAKIPQNSLPSRQKQAHLERIHSILKEILQNAKLLTTYENDIELVDITHLNQGNPDPAPAPKKSDLALAAEYILADKEFTARLRHPIKGHGDFELSEHQKTMLSKIAKGTKPFFSLLSARQTGTSTVSNLLNVLTALSMECSYNVIIGHNWDAAKDCLHQCEQISHGLIDRMGLDTRITKITKSVIEFSNGSRINAMPVDAYRFKDHTISNLFIMNSTMIPNNMFSPFWEAVYPCMVMGTNILAVSTSSMFSPTRSRSYSLFTDAAYGHVRLADKWDGHVMPISAINALSGYTGHDRSKNREMLGDEYYDREFNLIPSREYHE